MNDQDLTFLRRAVALAAEAVDAGDQPFGSVLVGGDGALLTEDRNRVNTRSDPTHHPELTVAQWAGTHLTVEQRRQTTVYTSGEHCPMCAAAHGIVGLGRIVFVASGEQFRRVAEKSGAVPSKVASLPITAVVPSLSVDGPVPGLNDAVLALYAQHFRGR